MKDYRTDCPMCGWEGEGPYGPNEICNHCRNELYNDEWEHHASYQKEEDDDDE
jgi:hypothetical protein